MAAITAARPWGFGRPLNLPNLVGTNPTPYLGPPLTRPAPWGFARPGGPYGNVKIRVFTGSLCAFAPWGFRRLHGPKNITVVDPTVISAAPEVHAITTAVIHLVIGDGAGPYFEIMDTITEMSGSASLLAGSVPVTAAVTTEAEMAGEAVLFSTGVVGATGVMDVEAEAVGITAYEAFGAAGDMAVEVQAVGFATLIQDVTNFNLTDLANAVINTPTYTGMSISQMFEVIMAATAGSLSRDPATGSVSYLALDNQTPVIEANFSDGDRNVTNIKPSI